MFDFSSETHSQTKKKKNAYQLAFNKQELLFLSRQDRLGK